MTITPIEARPLEMLNKHSNPLTPLLTCPHNVSFWLSNQLTARHYPYNQYDWLIYYIRSCDWSISQ